MSEQISEIKILEEQLQHEIYRVFWTKDILSYSHDNTIEFFVHDKYILGEVVQQIENLAKKYDLKIDHFAFFCGEHGLTANIRFIKR
jgi:hypothetical protein